MNEDKQFQTSPVPDDLVLGRPRKFVDPKILTCSVDAETVRLLLQAGGGNKSLGVRRLAWWYKEYTSRYLSTPFDKG